MNVKSYLTILKSGLSGKSFLDYCTPLSNIKFISMPLTIINFNIFKR